MPNERDSIKVAVVQPNVRGRGEQNVELAERHIGEAAATGAELVLLPEVFPGPGRIDADYDAEPRIAAAAVEHSVHVAWGRIEPDGERWLTVHLIHDPAGDRAVRYPRAHPATGNVHPILNGGAWISPGEELCTFDAAGVRFGLLICSELWQPEVARILALRGAEAILAPAGGGFTAVGHNWEVIARARAIENGCHVLLTHSRFDDEPGSALIAGPEETLARSPQDAVIAAELDLERARWLAAHDDSMEEPKSFRSLPGLLRARRPQLYSELADPVEEAYDYDDPDAIRPARSGTERAEA